MAEVPREMHDGHTRVTLGQFVEYFGRAVATAIVHEHPLRIRRGRVTETADQFRRVSCSLKSGTTIDTNGRAASAVSATRNRVASNRIVIEDFRAYRGTGD